eukprot:COSAG05_NODE_130_length_17165_cov_154.623638_4_plen_112_part_00
MFRSYPAVYITRKEVDIDDAVDPEIFHPNVTLISQLLPTVLPLPACLGCEAADGGEKGEASAWSAWRLFEFTQVGHIGRAPPPPPVCPRAHTHVYVRTISLHHQAIYHASV